MPRSMFLKVNPFMPLMEFLWTAIVVWIYDTFYNNFRIEDDFTKYLKESC